MQLRDIFANSSLQLYVFSEGQLGDGFKHFDIYDPVYVSNLSVSDTFYHFITSDVLVTSGSSFAAAAAMLKRPESLVLQARPKEGNLGIYEMSEHAIVADNGTILSPSLSKLRDVGSRIRPLS